MRAILVFAALGVSLAVAPALAHAVLTSSSPAAGSAMRAAPREVVLSFSEKLEPALSRVTVQNESGAHVDRGNARVSGSQIRVALANIGPGFYRVIYRVTSVDTHSIRGE